MLMRHQWKPPSMFLLVTGSPVPESPIMTTFLLSNSFCVSLVENQWVAICKNHHLLSLTANLLFLYGVSKNTYSYKMLTMHGYSLYCYPHIFPTISMQHKHTRCRPIFHCNQSICWLSMHNGVGFQF